ncbi:MAG: hypothetical protein KKH93_03055 [Candidatus Omnitrophica bacterium]|nr:hypothetical protein [Candidatus Omnitrophota bacterium]MBU2044832.1 hypothetical protein [Candidatus Omnitrophota bacterium]MBU2473653.1 hypothetical protein [Candidatus Omnitrophota bacterium]
MKKILLLTIPLFIFIASLIYLHQKVQIYVQAYRLNSNHERYNELVDKRDYLMYNFAKEVSLSKVNQWAENEFFAPVGKERVIALGFSPRNKAQSSWIAKSLSRFLKTSAPTLTVLAEDSR